MGKLACRATCLAGDEFCESKNSQLSSLWQDLARRGLEWDEFFELGKSRLSSVWRSESLERREALCEFWSDAALLVQRLWLSFFMLVAILCAFFPFFFVWFHLIFPRRFFGDL